jgi:triosephosphate isomerase
MSFVPLVVGNWKLNPVTMVEAKKIFTTINQRVKKLTQAEVMIAPPFPFIPELIKSAARGPIGIGAQNIFYEEKGAFTGEVSATLLAGLGVKSVIIGHSERRARGETDADVQRKVRAALQRKLIPIVCIGEQSRDGNGQFFNVIEQQLLSLVVALTPAEIKRVIIAYEPIWAIGTGLNATPENVKEMQLFITTFLTKHFDRATAKRVRLLYGGSVKADNAEVLHAEGGMQGFLVGGASLLPDDFIQIIKATAPRG